ncbi:hypothetical protein [Trueperella sp. LYQ143]|uniref:hypothetical protein n=1 Tax=Trueperella sp. LYQ143 TaxID=3391059 RepID=UPI003983AF40
MKLIIATGSAGKNIAQPLEKDGFTVIYLDRKPNESAAPTEPTTLTESERGHLIAAANTATQFIIVFGGGGPTGTSLAIETAHLAHQLGIGTAAYVTHPLSFEGQSRARFANTAAAEFRKTNTQVTEFALDDLINRVDPRLSPEEFFRNIDEEIRNAIRKAAC